MLQPLPMPAATSRRRTAKIPAKTQGPSRVREAARELYRRAILDAAEHVFSERGVAAARVQDIAVRAGLGVGTIYNHFDQKEDVLIALLDERTTGFLEAFEPTASDPAPFRERLVARVLRLMAYIENHQMFFRLASDHGLFGSPTVSASALLGGRKIPHLGRYEEAILELVDEGLDARALAPLDRNLLALHLRGSIRSSVHWMRQEPDVSADRAARAAVHLFLEGATSPLA
jgi:AcrR family transcriptional regulator